MSLYVDASVLVRRLLREPGVTLRAAVASRVYSSIVVEVEVVRALDRARVLARIDEDELAQKYLDAARLLATVRMMPVSRQVVDRARAAFPMAIRAIDALHVATAEVVRAEAGELEFWTHDARQANAARSRALEVRGDEE